MPFIDTRRDLGRVKVGTTVRLVYKFSEDITIKKVMTSCGCTMAQASNDTKEIVLEYKAAPVPIHFIREKKFSYPAAKTATVFFEATGDIGIEQQETLSFKAIVFQ